MVSVPPNIFGRMTTKRSQFGSLEDRTRQTPTSPPGAEVRHVLLDGSCPGLVIDRRKTVDGQWQGLVVRVEENRLIIDWVSGDRITKP